MAYHHHPCHGATTSPATCHCHCCWVYTPCHHYHPPPPDPHLYHPPHQPHLYSTLSHRPNLPQHHDHYLQEGIQAHPTVTSLLRRIAVLEAALRRRSSHTSSSQSLRDAAARIIQSRFRAFLSRRSRTLRLLKDLASIRSTLGALKSSVSEKTHFDFDVVYQKAVTLLLKLDTIKGGDPMVINGKSSISRELNKFLDFVDGVSNNVKSGISSSERKMGNVESEDLN